MGIFKNLKNYFKRKEYLKKLDNHYIPNILSFDNNNKTIVFINRSMPTHDKDSGSNRLREIIIAFKENNYNCIICTKNAYIYDPYIQHYIDLGIIVYVETNLYSNYFHFLKNISKIDYIWYYSPDTFKDNYFKISKLLPNSKALFDMVDIHFLRLKRAIEIEPKRISLRKKFKKYYKIETILSKKSDYIIAISENEKKIISNYVDIHKIIVISNIHYPKIDLTQINSFEKRENLLFIGSSHSPNIDAIYFLNQEIMPLVWKKIPELKVIVIGNVNEKITTPINEKIVLKGYVNDIIPYFIQTKFMIAPLRYGAGVKGKIGQAFEYYLPVITTQIGAEGMELKDGINAIIKNTALDYANAIIELYYNKEMWLKLQNNSENSLSLFSKDNLHKIIKQNFNLT